MAKVIQIPIKTSNQSLIRLCLKILIEVISNQAKMLFSKDKNIYDGSIPSSLIPKLEKEMEHYREELLELLRTYTL
jgi:hypothetical protein